MRYPRKRNTPDLQTREKERAAKKAEDIKIRKARKKAADGFRLRDENAPMKLESKDTVFIVYRERLKNFPWKKLTITFVVIMLGGIGSAVFQARNANIQNDIARAERTLREYQNANFEMTSRLQERYTFYEIERLAAERLGMAFPDPSQIVNIEVPRVGGVTLNTVDYALPQQNYFWRDIRSFFSGIINSIFG